GFGDATGPLDDRRPSMKRRLRWLWRATRGPLLGLAFAFVATSALLLVLGERPTLLAEAMHNTLFTGFGLGYTLFYTTPLVFTGLGVALAAHCGLFNIGAEGQLHAGAIAAVAVGICWPGMP